MKKIRNYIVVSEEKALIQKLFEGYINGSSLKQLSDLAQQTGLKFRENTVTWNKNMISRILDSKQYWNGEKYPPILTQDIAVKVAEIKRSKVSPKSEIPFIQKRMTCLKCGAPLQRNSKKTPKIYWDCKECGIRFGPLSNDELLYIVTAKFLEICQNPQLVEPNQVKGNSLSMQAARLTNEINQMLDQREVDTNKTLSLTLECAAEKYKTCSIKESDHLTIKLKTFFQEHSNDEKLDRELFEQTVKRVILQPDGSVQLQLLNDIII